VAYWAHVGGFAFGFAIALAFLRRRTTLPSWRGPMPPPPV
jgi:membrane associated rhomboid family serine protease